MAKARLGQILQDSLREGTGVAQPTQAPRDDRRLAPAWLYLAGAAAAGVFAAGALLVMVAFTAHIPAWTNATWILLSAGAAMLGIVWLATLGRGVGGILPMLGCAAVPISIHYFRSHMFDRFFIETTLAILGLGFGLFAGGHLLARGIHAGVRALTAMTLIAVIVAFTAEARHWHLSSLRAFYTCAFGGLALIGIALAANLAFVAQRARMARSASDTTP